MEGLKPPLKDDPAGGTRPVFWSTPKGEMSHPADGKAQFMMEQWGVMPHFARFTFFRVPTGFAKEALYSPAD